MSRRLALLSLLALTACGGGGEDEVNFHTVAQGHAFATGARTAVLRDKSAWSAFWAAYDPRHPAPPVDFNKRMVLAVVTEAEDECTQVVITRVTEDDTLEVEYTVVTPATVPACKPAKSYPAHLVVVPTSSKSVGFTRK